jgi:hypothetical protein
MVRALGRRPADNMSMLEAPKDGSKPLFVYGLLKRGELAFGLVDGFTTRVEPAHMRGALRIRDGLPLLDIEAHGSVDGWLLWFETSRLAEAWSVICSFEPAAQYRWDVGSARVSGEEITANVLAGRKLRAATASEPVSVWSARSDPVFTEGMAEVRRLVSETASSGVGSQPDTEEFWRLFFRLQAAYLLLWSIVERYTAFRFGPAIDPTRRAARLDDDEAFRAAVLASGAKPGTVVDSRDPERKYRLAADGKGAAQYFYAMRSNLSHRGKSAYRDAQLVYKATTELAAVMEILVGQQLSADTESR